MNIRILSLILNVILDFFAIKLGYGVSGVAWATVVIEVINMIMVLILVKSTVIYKIDRNCLKELINLSKHGAADRIFDRGGKLFLNVILSRLGTYEYAAHVILNEIESFANDFCYGFSVGISTTVGIAMGKNDKNEIKELRNVLDKIIAIFVVIIPIVIFITLIILLPILLKEEETLFIAYKLIPFVILYAGLMPIRYKYSSIIGGMKEFKFNAQLSAVTNVTKVLLAYVLCKLFGVFGVWVTFSIAYMIIILISKRKVDVSI